MCSRRLRIESRFKKAWVNDFFARPNADEVVLVNEAVYLVSHQGSPPYFISVPVPFYDNYVIRPKTRPARFIRGHAHDFKVFHRHFAPVNIRHT